MYQYLFATSCVCVKHSFSNVYTYVNIKTKKMILIMVIKSFVAVLFTERYVHKVTKELNYILQFMTSCNQEFNSNDDTFKERSKKSKGPTPTIIINIH